MIKSFYYVVILCFTLVNLQPTTTASEEFVSTNEFSLFNRTTFSLVNIHRDHAPLWFAIHGATIEQTQMVNSSTRRFKLSDHSLMHFSIYQQTSAVTEYYLIWHGGGNVNARREVCFHYGKQSVYWYGGYQSPSPSWPLATNHNLSKLFFNYLHDWRSSKAEYAHILEPLFLNSDGFAVLLDQYQPLFIRKDVNRGNPLLCFSVSKSEPYMANNPDPTYLDLKIHMFASSNIRAVTDYVIHKSGYIPKLKSTPDERLFSQPYWRLWAQQNQQTIENRLLEFVEKSRQHGLEYGHIEIDVFWKREDFTVNSVTLPNFDSTIALIHDRGHRLVAPIIPDVLRNSQTTSSYFIRNASGQKVDYVDFSNPRAGEWFESLLRKLHYDDGIDSYFLDCKTLAPGFQLYDPKAERYPNELTTKYLEAAARIGNNTAKQAFKTQHLPLFLQLWTFGNQTPNDMVRSLVASALSVSIAGYPFVIPYRIGMRNPSEEMYIRWVQASALMPRMAFQVPPWEYSADCVRLTKKFIGLHFNFAQVMIDLAKKRVQTGSPIIRPMWYAAPDDRKTYRIDDQFMLGDDYVVAPVLIEGQRARSVYLPAGTWIDQYKQTYTGPGEWSLAAPLETLLYFKRI